MTSTQISASLRFALGAVAVLMALGCGSPVHAQSVAVMVNGEAITNYDVEQREKLTKLSSHKAATRDETLNELIDEKVKIKEAKRFGVDPTGSDVDAAYASMSSRMRLSPDQLTKLLAAQGIRPDTLKSRLKADMVWGSLVRGRFKDSLLVAEKDVQSAAKGDDKGDSESFEYQMRPIVLIVPKGSSPSVFDSRRKEADLLRDRIESCAQANDIFKVMQNAAIRDTVVKTSADLPESIRAGLDKTPVGHLTAPEVTRQGIEMVALCARKPTTLDTPKKREARDKLFAEKYEAKSKSYLSEVRKAAMIEYPRQESSK